MALRSWMLVILGLGSPALLQAQWQVGVEVMAERVGGVLRATDEPERSFAPYRPFWIGLRVEGGGGTVRPALSLFRARPDLALEGKELAVVPRLDLITVYAAQPLAVLHLARLRDGVRLRGEAGPVLELWQLKEKDDQWRLGAQVGVSLEVALGGRFSGIVGGHLGLLPRSPLTEVSLEDLDDTFEPTAAWRRSLRGGMRIRL